ncbi:MAG: hypothetical protein KAH05_08490 [Clostridiales bacterium]|nr:hypothetical protein [Clostridiales bacterium]
MNSNKIYVAFSTLLFTISDEITVVLGKVAKRDMIESIEREYSRDLKGSKIRLTIS